MQCYHFIVQEAFIHSYDLEAKGHKIREPGADHGDLMCTEM